MTDAALIPDRRAMPAVRVVATGLEWAEGPVGTVRRVRAGHRMRPRRGVPR